VANTPPIYHYNNFGFTVGGPFFHPQGIQHGQDQDLLLVSEEWFKNTQPGSASFAAATASEIAGTIPDTYNSDTNTYTPFTPAGPNGLTGSCTPVHDSSTHTSQVSSSCFSSNTNVYLTNVYDKNPGKRWRQLRLSYSAKQDQHQDIVRVDHYFNEKLHFFARA